MFTRKNSIGKKALNNCTLQVAERIAQMDRLYQASLQEHRAIIVRHLLSQQLATQHEYRATVVELQLLVDALITGCLRFSIDTTFRTHPTTLMTKLYQPFVASTTEGESLHIKHTYLRQTLDMLVPVYVQFLKTVHATCTTDHRIASSDVTRILAALIVSLLQRIGAAAESSGASSFIHAVYKTVCLLADTENPSREAIVASVTNLRTSGRSVDDIIWAIEHAVL